MRRGLLVHTNPKRMRGSTFFHVSSSLARPVGVAFFLQRAISSGVCPTQQRGAIRVVRFHCQMSIEALSLADAR
jgi:hypothetical protein